VRILAGAFVGTMTQTPNLELQEMPPLESIVMYATLN